MRLTAIFYLFSMVIGTVTCAERQMMMRSGRNKGKCSDSQYKCPQRVRMDPAHDFGNHIAIANRAGGTVSLVNPESLKVVIDLALPDEGEPLYIASVSEQGKSELWVVDRKNSRIVILRMKGCNIYVDGYIPTSAGPFHALTTQSSAEKYPIFIVSCDIGKVIEAYDVTTRRHLGTMNTPLKVIEAGAKPHDTFLNKDYAFVSFAGVGPNGPGFVASYDINNKFSLVAVLETTTDPHGAIRGDSDVYIATRPLDGDSPGSVMQVSVPYLEVIKSVERPSPHGMFMSLDSKYLYTTNIANGGEMAIDVWDLEYGLELVDCDEPVTTSKPIPHNPVLSNDGKMMYITHSGGTSVSNSAFTVGDDGCLDPRSEMVFETGLNPFGLHTIPPAEALVQCVN